MDTILHVKDLKKFRAEASQLARQSSELFFYSNGKLNFKVTKIPVKYSDNESVCLVKGVDLDLSKVTSIKKLGECVGEKDSERYEFTSEEDRLTYERIRGPLDYSYEIDGKEIKAKHPYMIGVFA